MKALLLLLTVLTAVYATLAFTFGRGRLLEFVFGPPPDPAVDFQTLRLPDTPNRYLVCPPNLCSASPNAVSPTFDEPVESLRQRWLTQLNEKPRTELHHSDTERDQYTYRVRTPVIHFPDYVTVQFIPLEGGRSTLAIYSRSLYGYSDLGVNRRRVEALLAHVQ